MTVSLSWPTTLPLPTMNGYGIEDKPRIARTDMESGTARQRRTSTQAPSEISVRWVFTLYEYAIFEAWLEHRAQYGAYWFNISYLGGVGLVPCEARFKDGKAPAKFQNGAIVLVTATLEVRERLKLTDSDLDLLLEEPAAPLFTAIDTFHTTVLWQLWPSGDDLYLIPGEDMAYLLAQLANFHNCMNNLWPH